MAAINDSAGKPLEILVGDCMTVLKTLPDESVQCVVTSPPYWGLRDYGHKDQIGQEETPWKYVEKLVAVFSEVRRVLRKDGTCWINLGDTYAGSGRGVGDVYSAERGKPDARTGSRVPCGYHEQARKGAAIGRAWVPAPLGLKTKDLVGVPWRVAFALQADGWYLRQEIIWSKPNPMPESVEDRCTKAHEQIFLLTKSARYFFDHEAIKEPAVYGNPSSASDILQPPGGGKPHTGLRPRSSKTRGEFEGKTNELPGREAFRAITDMRNKRSVWTVPISPYKGAHFATFPPDLILPCILAGSKPGDVVLDPFGGSGTTGRVAIGRGRRAVLIELNSKYAKLCEERCSITLGLPISA